MFSWPSRWSVNRRDSQCATLTKESLGAYDRTHGLNNEGSPIRLGPSPLGREARTGSPSSPRTLTPHKYPQPTNLHPPKYSWISQLLFVFAVTISKLSIVWSYARLSPSKVFKYTLFASGGFIILYGISFALAVVLRCNPINSYWASDPNHRAGCFEENGPLIISSAINIFTDIWLVVLPIPILWKLHLPSRQRVILIILMSLGILVCVAGIVRIYYLIETLLQTYDVTWEGYTVWLWTSVEIQLGIITTSVPPLRPLIRLYFPNILGKGSVASKAGHSAHHTSMHIPGFQMVTGGDGNANRKSTPAPYEDSARSASTERLQDRERDLQRQAQTGKGYASPV